MQISCAGLLLFPFLYTLAIYLFITNMLGGSVQQILISKPTTEEWADRRVLRAEKKTMPLSWSCQDPWQLIN